MIQPPGFEQLSNTYAHLVCKLQKGLYGLKCFLINNLQFQALVVSKNSDSCSVFLSVYVDDIVVTCPSPSVISDVIQSINHEFCQDLHIKERKR